jgi:hypothetical protein
MGKPQNNNCGKNGSLTGISQSQANKDKLAGAQKNDAKKMKLAELASDPQTIAAIAKTDANAVISINGTLLAPPSSFYYNASESGMEVVNAGQDNRVSSSDENEQQNDQDDTLSDASLFQDVDIDNLAAAYEAVVGGSAQEQKSKQHDWQQAGKRKPKKSQVPSNTNDRLPAIKFTISPTVASEFANPIKLSREVLRCFPSIQSGAIKFATIRKNFILIATDNKEAHQTLSGTWPPDAFTHGIRKSGHSERRQKVIVRGVHRELAIDDPEISNQLAGQGLLGATRIVSNRSGSAMTTSIITGFVQGKSALNMLLARGLIIGIVRHRVEVSIKAKQCYKCQQVDGHTAASCPNKQVCLKCGGEHKYNECSESELKCANCGKNHAACSRKCEKLARPNPRGLTYAKVAASRPKAPRQNERATHEKAPTTTGNQPDLAAKQLHNEQSSALLQQMGELQKQLVDLGNQVAKLAGIFSKTMEAINARIDNQINAALEQLKKASQPETSSKPGNPKQPTNIIKPTNHSQARRSSQNQPQANSNNKSFNGKSNA